MGNEIPLELISAISGISHESILDAFEEGIRNQLLVRDVMGRERVSFVHARIREAFYQRLDEEERTRLHRTIGYQLEKEHKEDLDSN